MDRREFSKNYEHCSCRGSTVKTKLWPAPTPLLAISNLEGRLTLPINRNWRSAIRVEGGHNRDFDTHLSASLPAH